MKNFGKKRAKKNEFLQFTCKLKIEIPLISLAIPKIRCQSIIIYLQTKKKAKNAVHVVKVCKLILTQLYRIKHYHICNLLE